MYKFKIKRNVDQIETHGGEFETERERDDFITKIESLQQKPWGQIGSYTIEKYFDNSNELREQEIKEAKEELESLKPYFQLIDTAINDASNLSDIKSILRKMARAIMRLSIK